MIYLLIFLAVNLLVIFLIHINRPVRVTKPIGLYNDENVYNPKYIKSRFKEILADKKTLTIYCGILHSPEHDFIGTISYFFFLLSIILLICSIPDCKIGLTLGVISFLEVIGLQFFTIGFGSTSISFTPVENVVLTSGSYFGYKVLTGIYPLTSVKVFLISEKTILERIKFSIYLMLDNSFIETECKAYTPIVKGYIFNDELAVIRDIGLKIATICGCRIWYSNKIPDEERLQTEKINSPEEKIPQSIYNKDYKDISKTFKELFYNNSKGNIFFDLPIKKELLIITFLSIIICPFFPKLLIILILALTIGRLISFSHDVIYGIGLFIIENKTLLLIKSFFGHKSLIEAIPFSNISYISITDKEGRTINTQEFSVNIKTDKRIIKSKRPVYVHKQGDNYFNDQLALLRDELLEISGVVGCKIIYSDKIPEGERLQAD